MGFSRGGAGGEKLSGVRTGGYKSETAGPASPTMLTTALAKCFSTGCPQAKAYDLLFVSLYFVRLFPDLFDVSLHRVSGL